jgi:hypothetical protein
VVEKKKLQSSSVNKDCYTHTMSTYMYNYIIIGPGGLPVTSPGKTLASIYTVLTGLEGQREGLRGRGVNRRELTGGEESRGSPVLKVCLSSYYRNRS